MDKLSDARVAVFGVGGVGGHVCEALVRSGIGEFDLIDKDTVDLSNLNRQIIALHSTIGKYKTEVMRDRMLDINPDVKVHTYNCFFLPETAGEFPFEQYDYIVDAIDTVTAKIELIRKAREYHIPIISAMGAGNKLDPSRFRVTDLFQTEGCPLARVMRRELRKRGISELKVVFSDEQPIKPIEEETSDSDTFTENKSRVKATPGSTAFVPAAAGLILAGEVVKDLIR